MLPLIKTYTGPSVTTNKELYINLLTNRRRAIPLKTFMLTTLLKSLFRTAHAHTHYRIYNVHTFNDNFLNVIVHFK